MPLLGFYCGDRRNNPMKIFYILLKKLLSEIKPIMSMPHHVKNFTLKFNARRICLSRTDMLPSVLKNHITLHVAFLTLVAGSLEPNCSNIIISPWVPDAMVSLLPLGFVLL